MLILWLPAQAEVYNVALAMKYSLSVALGLVFMNNYMVCYLN